jgi:hypothetical protein
MRDIATWLIRIGYRFGHARRVDILPRSPIGKEQLCLGAKKDEAKEGE